MEIAGIAAEELREQARTWLAEHKAEAPRDYGAILPPELVEEGRGWQRTLFAAGWTGLHWPTEHGGRGLTPAHTAAWTTECAIAEVPPWINMVGLVLTGGSILAFGTPEQQAAHLPGILRAEQVWCQLFSEPGAGSDLASRCRHRGPPHRARRSRSGPAGHGAAPGTRRVGRRLPGQARGDGADVRRRRARIRPGRAESMLQGGAAARRLGAPGGRIAGGTTQVQKNIIGERLLGLPKEPSA